MRRSVSSGSPWESKIGYSRAVKVGNQIFVSGTTASDLDGNIVGENDPFAQTIFILKKIQCALEDAGSAIQDVVRTRMYVVNIDDWEAIGCAHNEFFADVLPAATMVEVKRLIKPGLLVEIEVDAVTES